MSDWQNTQNPNVHSEIGDDWLLLFLCHLNPPSYGHNTKREYENKDSLNKILA